MDELAMVARRARRAAELSRARAALRLAPALAVFVGALAAFAPAPSAALGAAVSLAVVAMRWRRRSWGRGASDGFRMGAPVAMAGALVRACAPGDGDWACGVVCIALGVGSAVLTGLRDTDLESTSEERLVLGAFGAMTAFAGCAGLGLGIALTAAIATTAAWAGALVCRRA